MNHQSLLLRRLYLDSRNEHYVFMRSDCPVCISEGFEALNRIRISYGGHSLVASLVVMDDPRYLSQEEVGLSEEAIRVLEASEGDRIRLSHLNPLDSMSDVRTKIYGNRLDEAGFRRIVHDVVERNLSNIQLSAFLTACAGTRLDTDEVIALTRAMIDVGFRIDWGREDIYDKHGIGGLPGNRTSPIVVSIAAAAGLTIPKTSSRAITSPSGTADTMETLTNVALSVEEMQQVVDAEGACLAWGGSMQLSPADDILIRVERALDIDSEGQLIASVLSKKKAVGSTHVVIEIPYGSTAKVRSLHDADDLAAKMKLVGNAVGLHIETIIADGSQPIGRGIGPALEAKDVLDVLRNAEDAPSDLREKSVAIAGVLLEMSGRAAADEGARTASDVLRSGAAWEKFRRICQAQGGLTDPPTALYRQMVPAQKAGIVTAIDNRKIAKTAKLAGAPSDRAAGVYMHVRLDSEVREGDPLFEVHAESPGELTYALDYLKEQTDIITIVTQ